MIVKELIELLQTMPQDAVVVYDRFSDVEEMRDDEVKLHKAEDKVVVVHNGRYMTYCERWYGEGEHPRNFVTVVNFPGN